VKGKKEVETYGMRKKEVMRAGGESGERGRANVNYLGFLKYSHLR